MKHLISWTLILFVLTTCNDKDDKNEILTAKFIDNGITTTKCLFRMYSDSTYTFDVHEYQEYRHEKNEIFRGRYRLKGDTIVFFPFDFDYANAETAIVKNNFLEFLGGKMPFKMKIVNGRIDNYKGIDTVKYANYSFFTYDTTFYHIFSKEVTPYDLTNEDLIETEKMLTSCVKDANLSFELKNYFRQCTGVTNKEGEREVWINLLCNRKDMEELKYFVIRTHDGGDCFFNVKLNLDNGLCYDFWVNGHA